MIIFTNTCHSKLQLDVGTWFKRISHQWSQNMSLKGDSSVPCISSHMLKQRLGYGASIIRKQTSPPLFSGGTGKSSPRENKGRYLLFDGHPEVRHVFTPVSMCNLAVIPTCLAPGLLRDGQEVLYWLLAHPRPCSDFPAAKGIVCLH